MDFLFIHSKRQIDDYKEKASLERLRSHDLNQAEGDSGGNKAQFIHPGVFAAQQALNQALQTRARTKTVTASAESRIVAYQASLALQQKNCRPVPVPRLPRASRNKPEEKQKHINAAQKVLFDAMIQRKSQRYLDRRQKDIDRCASNGCRYLGRSKWKIKNKMARGWRRTATLRSRLETNPETRRLITASKHVDRARPDERVADAEAIKRGRTEAAKWRPPPEKPVIVKRKWLPSSGQQRKRRKLHREPQAAPMAIEWTPPPPAESESTETHIDNDDVCDANKKKGRKRKRGRIGKATVTPAEAKAVGRV